MKKKFYSLFVMPLMMALVFASCDKIVTNSGDDPGGDPDVPGSGKVYQDKSDFEEIALELADEFKASDFENLMDLAEYIAETYSEYETDKVDKWFDTCLDKLSKRVYRDVDYPVYEYVYGLSGFKGKFVAENGRWERYSSENLSFHVKDKSGAPCEIVLTTSGATKKVHYYDEYEYYGRGDYYYGEYYEEIVASKNEAWVEVPENVNIVLSQNGTKLLELVIKTDLSSMVGDEFNICKDKYNVTSSLYFNGYTMELKEFTYANNKESKVVFEFKHGSKVIINSELRVTPEILESIYDDEEDDDYYYDYEEDYEEDDYKNFNFKNNIWSVNILNKLQIKGACEDLVKLLKVLDAEWDDTIDSKINRHLDINMFFYGSNEPTAKIKFECEERYDEDEYWYYDEPRIIIYPIMVFNDGSRYSMEEFFNEDDFEKVIIAFENLFKEFEDLVNGYNFDS